MGISARTRRKSIDAARKLLPPNPIAGYAPAVAGSNPVAVTSALVVGWVAVAAGSMVALGSVIAPGVLVLIAVKYALNPPRAVVTVDGGVALLKRSFVNGRPNEVVALLPAGSIVPRTERSSYVQLQVGPELVWMQKKEHARLLQAGAGGFIGYGYAGGAPVA